MVFKLIFISYAMNCSMHISIWKKIHHISCGSKYDLVDFYTINLLIEKSSTETRYHKDLEWVSSWEVA